MKWIRLEVGYESAQKEDCTQEPPMHAKLLHCFDASNRLRWALGSKTTITLSDGTDEDAWVREVLETEINEALQDAGEQPIQVDELRRLFPELGNVLFIGNDAYPTGKPGTRCKLVGEHWVNSRSYALLDDEGDPWPSDRDPGDALVFATLHWNCWPSD